MFSRLLCVTVLSVSLALTLISMSQPATAQTIRFDTNVGSFDMELNPTGNPNLQGHVDNMLAYVNAGRYEQSFINRAENRDATDPADDFILQLGGFQANTLNLPGSFTTTPFPDIGRFDPVVVDTNNDGQVDFDTTNLTNIRGTVTLALGTGQPNTGNSSFFINSGDNASLLDPQGFVVFATISDMSTVDLIMSLINVNYSGVFKDPTGDFNPTFTDVPILGDNTLLIVERVFVLDPPSASAAAAAAAAGGGASLSDGLSSGAVPEPTTLLLASLGWMAMVARRRWR